VLRGIGAQPESADRAAARLRAATRHYEQHVIAWHALGRLSEARTARDDIARYGRKLQAELDQPANPPIGFQPRPLTKTRGAGSLTHRRTNPMLSDAQGNERPFWGWLKPSGALDEIRGADAGLEETATTLGETTKPQEGQ
jgi:hypothetical protein